MFDGLYERSNVGSRAKPVRPGENKVLRDISEAFDKVGLRDGMTVSFHHHMRNGDKVVNLVMEAIAAKGIKDIRVAASGLFAVHEPLVKLMEDGVITQIVTSTFNSGPVPKAITAGKLKKPCIMMTHGGRPRAIMSGDLHIDVAFISAPTCDTMGNINGTTGKSPCGYLSYAYADAEYADHVVAVTDNLVPYPACPIEITQEKVDYIVPVESIGDPGGIVSGTTKITDDPVRLKIASDTAELMEQVGMIREGMSFQTGASSTALAVAADVRKRMLAEHITGSFALGGIHAYMVKMLEEGLFSAILDTQCFDLDAIRSEVKNPNHMAISGSQYANPFTSGPVVNMLDTVILGATEIATDFNVNVTTGSNGVIMGAAGGHSDCASGAKLSIIVANLTRKSFCIVRDHVMT
ncbi:MAG: citrate lyase subunit alpha, partial [Lachnospiraceae bacterium]|nr:citrate lyase subunit alpha [Lachnospiraceae bacterium]